MAADQPWSPAPALRASDADRDRAIETLHAAVADGRLDPVEFDERLDAALTARTIDALAPLVADLNVVQAPAGRPVELLTIKERHGFVRREGRWALPHRLSLRTAWCDVLLDLTSAVRTAPRLVIEARVTGGNVELVLAPGMTVDTHDLSVRHSTLEVSKDVRAEAQAPQTLHISLTGRLKHGGLTIRWQPLA